MDEEQKIREILAEEYLKQEVIDEVIGLAQSWAERRYGVGYDNAVHLYKCGCNDVSHTIY